VSETDRICQQLKQALEGDAWHGPALLEILVRIGAETAFSRPIADAHSIWEIVLHLSATQRLMHRRIEGDPTATELPPAEDWPAVRQSTTATWEEAVRKLEENEVQLRSAIAAFPPELLDRPLIPGGRSAYNNFHGYVQHIIYHTGQIALLKRAAGE